MKKILFLFLVFLVLFTGCSQSDSEKDSNSNKMGNIVNVETNYGSFKIELFLNESPITAGNFKKLVESGYYDNTKFHRIIDGFMIQGGDPLTKNDSLVSRWGTGGPGYAIEDEFVKGLSNTYGTISMANSGPNSGGSQFFINVADNSNLDWDKQPSSSKHPVFGKVIEGINVVEKISKVQTNGRPYDRPIEAVIIESATIE